MNIKLLTEQHLELLSFKGGCTGSSESTLVKMTHCWKSHVTAQICLMDPWELIYFFTGVFILVIVGYKYSAEIKGTVYRSDVASEVKKMSQSEPKTWKTSEFKSLPVEAKQDLDKVTVKEADLPIKLDGKV